MIACSRYPISCNVRRQQHAEFRARSTSTKMNYAIESDVPVVHFRKNWYQSLSFTKICHWRVVPKNFRKKGAPYLQTLQRRREFLCQPNLGNSTRKVQYSGRRQQPTIGTHLLESKTPQEPVQSKVHCGSQILCDKTAKRPSKQMSKATSSVLQKVL